MEHSNYEETRHGEDGEEFPFILGDCLFGLKAAGCCYGRCTRVNCFCPGKKKQWATLRVGTGARECLSLTVKEPSKCCGCIPPMDTGWKFDAGQEDIYARAVLTHLPAPKWATNMSCEALSEALIIAISAENYTSKQWSRRYITVNGYIPSPERARRLVDMVEARFEQNSRFQRVGDEVVSAGGM